MHLNSPFGETSAGGKYALTCNVGHAHLWVTPFTTNLLIMIYKAPSVPFSLFFTLDSFSVILLFAQCIDVKAFNTKDLNTLTSVHLI